MFRMFSLLHKTKSLWPNENHSAKESPNEFLDESFSSVKYFLISVTDHNLTSTNVLLPASWHSSWQHDEATDKGSLQTFRSCCSDTGDSRADMSTSSCLQLWVWATKEKKNETLWQRHATSSPLFSQSAFVRSFFVSITPHSRPMTSNLPSYALFTISVSILLVSITAILQCIRLMGRVAVIEIPHPR